MKVLKYSFSAIFLLLILFIFSCEKEEEISKNTLSGFDQTLKTRTVDPVFYPGNMPGDAYAECGYTSCDGDFAWKIDEAPEVGEYDFNTDMYGNLPTDFDATFTVTSADGTFFSWSSDVRVCAVIVKGGPVANIYYMDGICEGVDFHAPMNENSGTYYEISHVTVCFAAAECGYEPEECFQEETAWVNDPENDFRYRKKGSWARYIAPDWSEESSYVYEILAGQNYIAGEATLETDGSYVTVTISLEDGWVFYYDAGDNEGDDNMKAQDYDEAPSGNPKIGQFDYKEMVPAGANTFEFSMPQNDFYGIHLDIGMPVDCE